MAKAPFLLIDTYDDKGKLVSSNRPSFLRKAENERVTKLKKEVKKDDVPKTSDNDGSKKIEKGKKEKPERSPAEEKPAEEEKEVK